MPKRLAAWRRRGRASVASDLVFLSPEERKELAGLKHGHGSDEKPVPRSFRRPR